jgi:malonyl-CoA decarboxylase
MSDAEPHIPGDTPASTPHEHAAPLPTGSRRPRRFFKRFFASLTGPRTNRPATSVRDAERVIAMCYALLSERGEVSGARLAGEVLGAYQSLDAPAQECFFDLLVDEFSPHPDDVGAAADVYRADPSPANLLPLQAAVEPRRQELFRRFNMAPGGTAMLVAMRRQLLQTLGEHPQWQGIDADLVHLFKSWFNRGFLTLQRIDWRTSALVLERLIQYEAVHQIQGWSDLRRRLEADRRCYAFFHQALPDEPLIFIEVALTRGMSATVQPLLDPQSPVINPDETDCAIFYSITNCQDGLRGISFGNFLIKQVAEDLGRSFARLRTFATLSPIPGFRDWLESSGALAAARPDVKALVEHFDRDGWDPGRTIAPETRTALCQLCAGYLLRAKKGKAPLDPVARFHLANGARLERLNWAGDTSEVGLRRSLGLTVNYVYRLDDVERNHEAYANDYRIVAAREFERLARQSSRADTAKRR